MRCILRLATGWKELALIWADVLGMDIKKERIGVEADFFGLGGHSLKAAILTAKVHKGMNVNIPLWEVFRAPTLGAMASYIRDASRDVFFAVERAEKRDYYRLSSAQKRLYLLYRLNPDSTNYNMPQHIPLGERPEREKLERTFLNLIGRHESFRTSFHMVGEEPVQVVHDSGDVEFEVEYVDYVRGKGNGHLFPEPFDLSRAPLMRAAVLEREGVITSFSLTLIILSRMGPLRNC